MDHHASWIPGMPGVNHHSIFVWDYIVTMISEKKSIKLVSRFETLPGGHFFDDFSNWEILCFRILQGCSISARCLVEARVEVNLGIRTPTAKLEMII